MGLGKAPLTPTTVDALIDKVRAKRVTNSKDLRKILIDPVAREHFLTREGDIDSAMLRLAPGGQKGHQGGLAGDLQTAIEAMKQVPWTALIDLEGDPEILKAIGEAEPLLKSLRRSAPCVLDRAVGLADGALRGRETVDERGACSLSVTRGLHRGRPVESAPCHFADQTAAPAPNPEGDISALR